MSDQEFDAGQLADHLDNILPPHQTNVPAAGGDALVRTAVRLASAPRPQMSPEAAARIQARVIHAARQQKKPRRTARAVPVLLRWAAVFVLAVFAFGAAAPTIASSAPGEVLYPVKRGLENVELLLAASPESQAIVHLNQAERRISEAQTLLARGQFDSQLVRDVRQSAARSVEASAQLPAAASSADIIQRAAQVNIAMNSVMQAAITAGVVTPEELNELIPPDPTPAPVEPASPTPPAPEETPAVTPTQQPTETETSQPAFTSTPQSTSQPVPVVPIAPQPGVIDSDRGVNVRSGPGAEFDIIAVLQPGTPVQVIGHSAAQDWLHIRLSDGRSGWVIASAIRAGTSPPVATPQPPAADNTDCNLPGKACDAPGHNKPDSPGKSADAPGQNKDNNPGGGPPDNPGQGNPPDNPGKGGGKK